MGGEGGGESNGPGTGAGLGGGGGRSFGNKIFFFTRTALWARGLSTMAGDGQWPIVGPLCTHCG